MAADGEKSWWREITIGVVIAIISAIILTYMGLSGSQAGSEDRFSAPGATPLTEASRLVGTWRADEYADGLTTTIFWTLRADGVTEYAWGDSDIPEIHGSWQFTDGILFERLSSGASAKGRVRWIDDDHFELTILDNGVPSYNGQIRNYHRQ